MTTSEAEVASIQADIHYMKADIAELKEHVAEVRDLLAQIKGAHRVLIWVGGLAAAVASGISWAWGFIKGNT
jgi:prefoldin subunit 5